MLSKVFIIAEAGVNHNGDPAMARQLIDEAAAAGADAVKFQTWDRELVTRRDNELVPYQKRNTEGVTDMYELGKTFELELSTFVDLAAHCKKRGVMFLSTGFDEPSLNFLVDELDVPIIKIPSGDAINTLLLRTAARTLRPIILSTGMCNIEEISYAIQTLREIWDAENAGPDLTLLHCTTAYPTPPDEMHLQSIKTLADHFGLPVGLSDHSEGITAAAMAVAMGAVVVEKHFTLDRDLPGPDHKASVNPEQLRALVRTIREAEEMMGSADKCLRSIEEQVVKSVRRSLVATRDIAAGETITLDMIVPLRPEDGIPVRDVDKVVGASAWRAFAAGEVLRWDD